MNAIMINGTIIHSKDWADSQRIVRNRSRTCSGDARSDGAPASFQELESPKAPPRESIASWRLQVPPATRNFFVALALALVLAVMLGLDSVVKSPIIPVTLLLIATAIGAWIGGFRASVLTAVLSWLAIDYLLTPSLSSTDFSPRDIPRFAMIFLMGYLVSWLVRRPERGQEEEMLRAHDESKRGAQAGAAEMNRLNREFSVSIAHEIRQPLSAMITNANACLRWLATQPSSVDEARAAAQRIVRDGDRAAQVIARIRALVTKEIPLRESSSINAVIDELLPVLNGDIQRRGVRVERVLTDGLPAVAIDRVQIQQLITNLVVNGLDAMSSITDRPRLLRIYTRHDSKRVLVAVEDSGIGLDPATIERLFDPFFTTKAEGLGMGLAICHSIIESHGGRLVAKPNDGPGSTFQFALPIETRGIPRKMEN